MDQDKHSLIGQKRKGKNNSNDNSNNRIYKISDEQRNRLSPRD